MLPRLFAVLDVLWLLSLPLALGAFPGTVAVRGLRLPSWAWLPLVVAGGALIAYVTFWMWFLWPARTRALSPYVVAASVLAFCWLLTKPDVRARLRDVDAWLPLVLMLAIAIAYLGYLRWPDVDIWRRFTLPVPPEDNITPRVMADRFYYEYFSQPDPGPITRFVLFTRSSDRPPLQAAIVLLLRRVQRVRDNQWAYQVIGTLLQLSWVPALYALGRAIRLTRRQLVFVLISAATSGFFLLYSIYTWPKLFAASLFLSALALAFHILRDPSARRLPVTTTVGALGALALLAHGGPFFSMLALPVLVVSVGAWRVFRVRDVACAVLAGLILLAPWMAYQRSYDPPGNVLLKLHFAGVYPPDTRSTLDAIRDAYRARPFSEFIASRVANVREQGFVLGKSGRSHVSDWLQWQQFFHHLPALDVLALGFSALVARRWRVHAAGPTAASLRALTLYAVCALTLWIVLLFEPGSTFIHHGSLATTSLLFFCGAAWAALLPRWAGHTILAAHAGIFVLAWCAMRTLAGAPAPRVWDPLVAAAMIAGFVGFFAALRWLPSPDDPASTPMPPS